ncbi:dihydrofolate reductase [Trichococcus patagoniensis]|uniref:Dihydrofolate reductase n=1 Tax=Trichococcus patagoniensis TaxID=382641 RepID=A0A2T5IM49_9LACT|nr:dihydrofolate reductase family protein [Trichococcus patagoniensis]PTQ84898.1 dihydrofolate reductase [Trichococcus patagoniensis]
MEKRNVKVYIAVSLDGYIAHSDGNIEWLDSVARSDEDYGYANFIETIDTVIMGRKTYDKVLSFGGEFPHAGRECFVFSRTERGSDGQVHFYNGPVEDLLDQIRRKPGKDIFIDGGSEAIDLFREKGLIDSYTVSIIPILLGEGIPLFKESNKELPLQLIAAKTFDSGLVQLTYEPINE